MNQFKGADISSKEVEDAVKSMSKDEIEAIEKEWDKSNEEGDNNEETNENDSGEVTADPKDQLEFAKRFGSMVMKDFRQNMTTLFDLIVNKAKKIKEETQNQREAEAANAQQVSETQENQ